MIKQRPLLKQAQGKMIIIATALEAVYRVTTPLLRRLENKTKLMRNAATDLEKKTPTELQKLKDENLSYTRESNTKVKDIINSITTACITLYKTFPIMAQRVFTHEKAHHEITKRIINWMKEKPKEYEKLFEKDNEEIDYTGISS